MALGSVVNVAAAGNNSILRTQNNVASVAGLTENANREEGKDFASILKNAITDSLNGTQQLIDSAESAEIEFALGKSENTHDLLVAQNKASLAVSYTVAVRDKLLDAYKEIMNMQV